MRATRAQRRRRSARRRHDSGVGSTADAAMRWRPQGAAAGGPRAPSAARAAGAPHIAPLAAAAARPSSRPRRGAATAGSAPAAVAAPPSTGAARATSGRRARPLLVATRGPAAGAGAGAGARARAGRAGRVLRILRAALPPALSCLSAGLRWVAVSLLQRPRRLTGEGRRAFRNPESRVLQSTTTTARQRRHGAQTQQTSH